MISSEIFLKSSTMCLRSSSLVLAVTSSVPVKFTGGSTENTSTWPWLQVAVLLHFLCFVDFSLQQWDVEAWLIFCVKQKVLRDVTLIQTCVGMPYVLLLHRGFVLRCRVALDFGLQNAFTLVLIKQIFHLQLLSKFVLKIKSVEHFVIACRLHVI